MGPITYLVLKGSHGPTFCPSWSALPPSAHKVSPETNPQHVLDCWTIQPTLHHCVTCFQAPGGSVLGSLQQKCALGTPQCSAAHRTLWGCLPWLQRGGWQAVAGRPNLQSSHFQTQGLIGTWSQSDRVAMAAVVCEQQSRWRQRGPRTYKPSVWPSHCIPSNPSPCPPQASMTSTGSCETL